MEPNGRVLMIACAFPPTGGSGVQRSAKFAKYLPRFGWRPVVWTADGLAGMPRDASLLAEIPDEVTIHAAAWSPPLANVQCAVSRLAESDGPLSVVGQAARWRLRAKSAAAERRMDPDHYISWAKDSLEPLRRLVEQEDIGVIYSTFSPASNHWLGLTLKRLTGLPWIADFRDLWTDDYRYVEKSISRRNSHRRLEREILETADAVVGATECQTRILADHVCDSSEKFLTITNGYDPDDFPETTAGGRTHEHPSSVDRCGNDAPFVMSHVGRFDHWRARDVWFGGLKRFVTSLGQNRDRFELRIVGHADQATKAKLEATGVRCSHKGHVDHPDAVQAMCAADALLLNVPDGPNAESVIPAKLFEYLASRRPILVVGPPGGEAERIVQSCHAGLTVGFDSHAITGALCELYDAWQSGRPVAGCAPERLDPYSRVSQTRHLAALLDHLTDRYENAAWRPATKHASAAVPVA